MTDTQLWTTITPQFQVHIPVKIRQRVGLKQHGRAKIKVEKKKIVIEPIKEEDSILSLGGTFRVKRPIPAEKIRDYIDYAWGKK